MYYSLKEQIIQLKLKPGAALSENEMASQFRVSRTPIRESFVRLAQEGLVQVIPQKGTFVALINRALVDEARFMRMQLELAIVKEACKSFPQSSLNELETNLELQKKCLEDKDEEAIFILDQQFHYTIFAGVNKPHIWNNMNLLTVHLDRCRRLRLIDNDSWQDIYQQHIQIYQAIKEKNIIDAMNTVETHLNSSVHDIEILEKKYPSYFN